LNFIVGFIFEQYWLEKNLASSRQVEKAWRGRSFCEIQNLDKSVCIGALSKFDDYKRRGI
jgi:hypothetical protein